MISPILTHRLLPPMWQTGITEWCHIAAGPQCPQCHGPVTQNFLMTGGKCTMMRYCRRCRWSFGRERQELQNHITAVVSQCRRDRTISQHALELMTVCQGVRRRSDQLRNALSAAQQSGVLAQVGNLEIQLVSRAVNALSYTRLCGVLGKESATRIRDMIAPTFRNILCVTPRTQRAYHSAADQPFAEISQAAMAELLISRRVSRVLAQVRSNVVQCMRENMPIESGRLELNATRKEYRCMSWEAVTSACGAEYTARLRKSMPPKQTYRLQLTTTAVHGATGPHVVSLR